MRGYSFAKAEKYTNDLVMTPIRVKVIAISGGEAMPEAPPTGPYPTPRRSPRFAFDALVKLLVQQLDQLQELWCRSTDLCQDGIGGNLIAGDLKPDGPVSLPILAVAERLGISILGCIVVGDSVWDLLAARRARALGIGLASGGYGQDELVKAGAYRTYEDPLDFLNHLNEVGVRIRHGE